MVTRQQRIDGFDHEGTPPPDQPLQILCEITSVRTSFRSCAGGVMARGEA